MNYFLLRKEAHRIEEFRAMSQPNSSITTAQVDEAIELLSASGYGVVPPANYLTDLEPAFQKLWQRVRGYTMTSIERGYSLYSGIRYICQQGIPGALAECGVWRGGSSMLIALTLHALGESVRDLYLYDTFEGMPYPGEKDVISSTGASVRERWESIEENGRIPFEDWKVGLDEVRSNMAATGYPVEKVHMIAGMVEKTLTAQEHKPPAELSLLRLDTDWYDSTRVELEQLYPRLSRGGVLIIDDYGHFDGARLAVDEFFASLPVRERPFLHRIDYTGRICIKP